MVVWGGVGVGTLGDGARYNPTTDTWSSIATTGAPGSRTSHTAIWNGRVVIIWGGAPLGTTAGTNTGGVYDP